MPLPGPDGQVIFKRVIPLGVVVDERITSGASYGQAFGYWRDLLADPCQLETPPESVRYDIEPEEKTASRKKAGAHGARSAPDPATERPIFLGFIAPVFAGRRVQ